jgi:hypothetical protein
MTETLNEITATFGEAYTVAKESGALRDEYQKRFFQAATEELETKVLAQRVVEIPLPSAQSIEDIQEYVSTYHPGWRFVSTREAASEEDLDVLVEQDPALMKFTYVNREDETVYGRTITEGQPYLDLEAIEVCNHDLYDAITEWPGIEMVNEILIWIGAVELPALPPDREPLSDLLTRWGFGRRLRDLNTVDTETLAQLDPYWIPGKISVRLVPPRAAKPEELE